MNLKFLASVIAKNFLSNKMIEEQKKQKNGQRAVNHVNQYLFHSKIVYVWACFMVHSTQLGHVKLVI